MTAFDPLEGVQVDHWTRAGVGLPEASILKGDLLAIRNATTAPKGAQVVANLDGEYAPRVHDGQLEVHGLIVGVFRTVEVPDES